MKEFVHLHPKYESLRTFVEELPYRFGSEGEYLHKGRNEIKLFDVQGSKYAVKYFKHVTIANRMIYRHFRKSKAQRSYENGLTLLERGIHTPQPIAYIERRGGVFLHDSYFVSSYVDYKSLDEYEGLGSEQFIKQFAAFLYHVHHKGVFHKDLNKSNILFQKDKEGKYQFFLIDNNRMAFKNPSLGLVVKNFDNIDIGYDDYSTLVGEYAGLYGVDPFELICRLLFSRHKTKKRRDFKYSFKRVIGL